MTILRSPHEPGLVGDQISISQTHSNLLSNHIKRIDARFYVSNFKRSMDVISHNIDRYVHTRDVMLRLRISGASGLLDPANCPPFLCNNSRLNVLFGASISPDLASEPLIGVDQSYGVAS